MMIVDTQGRYSMIEGTRRPKNSEHPVHQARIEMALDRGSWWFAPNQGHDLARFKRVSNSDHKREELQKEVAFYLKKYGPQVAQTFADRTTITERVVIAEDALNV